MYQCEKGALRGELVTFKNGDGFHLDGLLFREESNPITVVHVHGSFGNFFQNRFLRVAAALFRDAGINLLSFNLAAHDGVAEGYWNVDDFAYVGGAVVPFESCLSDISAAVQFCEEFSDRVVLQGHSLGCDRVLWYLLQRGAGHDLILLSPCDSYELQTLWIRPETVEDQIARIRCLPAEDSRFDWLSIREYGIRSGDEDYPIPVTRTAFLSIAEGPPFRLLRLSSPQDFWIDARVAVYLGGKDSFQTSPCHDMFSHLEARIRDVAKVYVPEGDHGMRGIEAEVFGQLAEWVNG